MNRDDFTCADLRLLNTEALRAWPLPMPSEDGDKEERGRVLIIGGSPEIPGAVLLAANAVLRAGAGKVAIATVQSQAQVLAIAMPEARVIALAETSDGGIDPAGIAKLDDVLKNVQAVLIGPGMQDKSAVCALVAALLPKLGHAKVILDACAMDVIRNQEAAAKKGETAPHCVGRFTTPVLLTPHAGEMAHLSGMDKDDVQADPCRAARVAARRWNAVIALKGKTTYIAQTDGPIWKHDGGNIGLAVSGSGDTLSGIIAGLAARGAPLEQACAWGVALHARAGEKLAGRYGDLGYLAREIPGEVPGLLHELNSTPEP